jgi:quinol monooxygenase YgiN
VIVSVTRLRLRSARHLLPFMWWAFRSQKQAARNPGCLAVDARKTRGLTFWTRSIWRDEAALKSYMVGEPHRKAMPKLYGWCDEAAIGRWKSDSATLPGWEEAEQRIVTDGRLSRVKAPSEVQAKGVINVS